MRDFICFVWVWVWNIYALPQINFLLLCMSMQLNVGLFTLVGSYFGRHFSSKYSLIIIILWSIFTNFNIYFTSLSYFDNKSHVACSYVSINWKKNYFSEQTYSQLLQVCFCFLHLQCFHCARFFGSVVKQWRG